MTFDEAVELARQIIDSADYYLMKIEVNEWGDAWIVWYRGRNDADCWYRTTRPGDFPYWREVSK